MDLNYTADDLAFRDTVRTYLKRTCRRTCSRRY